MTLDELKREYEIARQRFHSHMSIKNGARLQELRSKIIQLTDEQKDYFQEKEEYNDNQEEQEREKCSQR